MKLYEPWVYVLGLVVTVVVLAACSALVATCITSGPRAALRMVKGMVLVALMAPGLLIARTAYEAGDWLWVGVGDVWALVGFGIYQVLRKFFR